MATAFKIHPYCDAFPDLSDEELKALAADIKDNGLQNPVWRYGGKIIDGKNRLKACDIADVKPDYREWSTKSVDPLVIDKELFDFVLSQNLKRRHLDASQRSMAAAKLAMEFDKVHPPKKEEKAESNGEVDGKKKDEPKEKQVSTLERAAEIMGVSPRSVDSASRVVKSGSTDLQEAVERGDVAVSDAAAVAVLSKAEQNALLAKVEKGAPNLRKAAGKKLKKPKPSKNAGKPATAFDDSEFDDHMKAMMGFFDDRVKKFPDKAYHRACVNALDKVAKEFKTWRAWRK